VRGAGAEGVILAAKSPAGRDRFDRRPGSFPGRCGAVAETKSWTVICPCCEATIVVDAQTGAIISHQEKAKPLASFEEMAKELENRKKVREQVFSQELGSMKDRERLLEEKFREAMKKAEKDKDTPYKNPLDYD
jgi:uncharacterized Zn finger protein (UPF0148 family)